VIKTFQKSILQPVEFAEWEKAKVQVSILRDDLMHPFISGNKWRKLKYNLEEFESSHKQAVVTFGGAFSNHLLATAAASKLFGFRSIGIVRGEEVDNEYISFLRKCGMALYFIDRESYRKKNQPAFIHALLENLEHRSLRSDDYFIIPEGGSNEAGVRGASEIMDDIQSDAGYIACACGTGATLAGIARALKAHQIGIGIQVLKGEGYIQQQVLAFNGNSGRLLIKDHYHFGGYAKKNKELINFCEHFSSETRIPVEPVYTGKLVYAIDDMIKQNFFPQNSKLTLIHTGGVFNFATPLI
jgi:1-aminocyclopropane-1-carboxylate deaminase